MKKYLTEQEIDNSLMDCIDLVKQNTTGVQKPHIVSLYRGSLPLGVKLSNKLQAPLSIIDYQSYDGKSKKPELMKNVGVTAEDLLVIIDDICDKGETLKLTEEYIKAWFPYNKILIYTIVGSQEHPKHYNYSIEHPKDNTGEKMWVVFPGETITDTRCKVCKNSEPCRDNLETYSHCNVKNKSFKNSETCSQFEKQK